MILYSDPKLLYYFLNLCQGNWHRTIYVKCERCPSAEHCPQKDFLMLPDKEGKPVILPVQDAAILFSEHPDHRECLFSINFTQFLGMYAAYFKTLQCQPKQCPAKKLAQDLTDHLYGW